MEITPLVNPCTFICKCYIVFIRKNDGSMVKYNDDPVGENSTIIVLNEDNSIRGKFNMKNGQIEKCTLKDGTELIVNGILPLWEHFYLVRTSKKKLKNVCWRMGLRFSSMNHLTMYLTIITALVRSL